MKCEFCTSDFVRKETYRAHIISHHKRFLTTAEFDQVIDKIKRFQPPSLDINQFTLEKQKKNEQGDMTDDAGEEIGVMEVIEDDSANDDSIAIGPDGDFYEETELYEDEQ